MSRNKVINFITWFWLISLEKWPTKLFQRWPNSRKDEWSAAFLGVLSSSWWPRHEKCDIGEAGGVFGESETGGVDRGHGKWGTTKTSCGKRSQSPTHRCVRVCVWCVHVCVCVCVCWFWSICWHFCQILWYTDSRSVTETAMGRSIVTVREVRVRDRRKLENAQNMHSDRRLTTNVYCCYVIRNEIFVKHGPLK